MNYTGILIGMVTIPRGEDVKKFFKEEFYENNTGTGKGLFCGYRNSIKKYCIDNELIEKDFAYLYKPKPYFVFGNYDLALLSLVDDFSLGNRHFNPLHKHKKDNTHKYRYQVTNGFIEDGFIKPYLRGTDRLPWLGIIKLKVNNSLLIGIGNELIQSIISKIMESDDESFVVVPYFSLENSEIEVLCFTDKYDRITSFITKVRNLNFDCLSDSLIGSFQKHSLLYSFFSKSKDVERFKDLYESHLFTSTGTTIGIELDYSYNLKHIIGEGLQLTTYIDVKPGHYQQLNKGLEGLGYKNILSCFGEDSMVFTTNCNDQPIPFLMINSKKLSNHLNKITSTITYEKPDNGRTKTSNDKFKDHKLYLRKMLDLSGIRFQSVEIDEMNVRLKFHGVSKVVCDRLIRAILDYNECVTDPHLFPYIIELQGVLRRVHKTIIGHDLPVENLSLKEMHKVISDAVDQFEKGFYCRYHQSFRFPELANFNIEFNSGLQNLLTTFNQPYVNFVNLLCMEGQQRNFAFIIVSGDDNIKSNSVRLRANAYMLFHPEFYLISVVKEAFNGYKTKLDPGTRLTYNANAQKSCYNLKKYISTKPLSKVFHETLNNYIDKDFVEYYTIDSWLYRIGFNKDYRLFSHWCVGNLLSTPDGFMSNRMPSEEQYIKTYFRLLIVLIEDKEHASEIFNELLGKPYDSILADYWRKFQKDFARIFNDFAPYGLEAGAREYAWPYISVLRLMKHSQELLKGYCNNELPVKLVDPMKARLTGVSKLAVAYLAALKDGQSIPYKPDIPPTIHISALTIAYLTLLTYFRSENIFGSTDKTKFVLIRDKNGSPIKVADNNNLQEEKKYVFPYMFDMHGGIFINSWEARKKYLNLRSVLYLSLFDFAMKEKLKFFK